MRAMLALGAFLIATCSDFTLQSASVPDAEWVTQAKSKLQGERVPPCALRFWPGWDTDGSQLFQISSCGKQAAEAGEDGIFLDLLSARGWHWDLLKQCVQSQKPRNFLTFYNRTLRMLFSVPSPHHRYPVAGFDACMM